MSEIIYNIINTTLNSFDFAFCIIVNIMTYLAVTIINESKGSNITKWQKRLVFIIILILVSAVKILIGGQSIDLIINSAILAPVSWSWVFKPLCARFGIDYKSTIE